MPSDMAQKRFSFSSQDMPPKSANAAYYFMDKARQKYKAQPQLVESVRLPVKIPTPEELDLDERLDRAVLLSNHLLQEATEQLGKLCVVPAELTPSEQAEKENAVAWTRGYDIANRTIGQWLDHNDCHYQGFVETVDEMQSGNIPIPTDVDIPVEPKTPSINQLHVPDHAKHWLKGSWEFREYRDADFVAARRAEIRALRQPSTGDLAGHNRAVSEPAANLDSDSTDSSIWKGKSH